MTRSLFLTSFVTLFLAELGDKTQLAILSLSSSTKRPWTVFLGGAAALVLLSALAAFAGESIVRLIPENILRKASAVVFIGMGFWTWFKS